ncbi:zincin-like metallopeptidase domain-containing protein [Sphingobacterium faecium]|nr:zincin-like metallopeptidase domain-containing protein [Sphingobacterium faecium]WGQ17003.1 zincin-like metallopeptidase domain-containing protein [Sphingobacterium faecium]
MKTATKKSTAKVQKAKSQKNASATKNNNPFLDMIIEGMEQLEQTEWEHYLKKQVDFTPKNLFTKRAYTRFNRLTLIIDMLLNQFAEPFYATFNQISTAGGKIKKGAKGRVIQYYNYIVKHKVTGEKITFEAYKKLSADEQKQYDVSAFVKYFRVFNIAWIENIEDINLEQANEDELSDLSEVNICNDAEAFISKLKDNKGLTLLNEKRNTACYSPAKDTVTMPPMEWFKNDVKYYSTLFHELIHWTGHKTRLDRFENGKDEEQYAFEELIAEMGAMLVYFDYDFKEEFINSLVYLKGWLKYTSKDTDRTETLAEAFKQSNRAVSFLYS